MLKDDLWSNPLQYYEAVPDDEDDEQDTDDQNTSHDLDD